MDNDAKPDDRQARYLTVALELLRRQLRDSTAFQFANHEREGPAGWALSALATAPQSASPSPDAAEPERREPAATPKHPPAQATAPEVAASSDSGSAAKPSPAAPSRPGSPVAVVPPVVVRIERDEPGDNQQPRAQSAPQSGGTAPELPPIPLVSDPAPSMSAGSSPNNAPPASPAPRPVFNIGMPDLPPIPLAGDKPAQPPPAAAGTAPYGFKPGDEPAWNVKGGAFGLGVPKPPETTSNTPAFDRPQSVIVVGPRPLPVSIEGAFKQAATTPRGARGGAEGGGGGLIMAMVRQFGAVLGPLYALSTVLGQTNSGMGLFQKSVNVLGSVLAPVMLPAFVLLAAGILAVSDLLWARLVPALGKFYEWALKTGIPQVEKRVGRASESLDMLGMVKDMLTQGKVPGGEDAFRGARSAVRQAPGGETADAAASWMGKKQLEGAAWLRRSMGLDDSKLQDQKERYFGSGSSGGKDEKNPDGTPKIPVGQRVSDAMRDVIKSLGMSMGPKGSISSLTGARDSAQLAALNQDPIEARQLKIMQDTFTLLQTEFNKVEAAGPQSPNTFRSDRR